MELPKSAILTPERTDELIRNGKEHIQVAGEGVAMHVVKDGEVFHVVREMTLEQAKALRSRP